MNHCYHNDAGFFPKTDSLPQNKHLTFGHLWGYCFLLQQNWPSLMHWSLKINSSQVHLLYMLFIFVQSPVNSTCAMCLNTFLFFFFFWLDPKIRKLLSYTLLSQTMTVSELTCMAAGLMIYPWRKANITFYKLI